MMVKDLDFQYDKDNHALQGISFQVRKGERIAILGPNGAGKSTLLHILAGLRIPTRGRVEVGGVDVGGRRKAGYVPGVGILFQDPDDQLIMPTVEEDVAFGPLNLGLERETVNDRVAEALRITGMEEFRNRIPFHLSFGEKKRVAMAGVLAMKPEILLLDEPTANLDPAGRRKLIDFLKTLKCTIILATHDITSAIELTDRALIIKGSLLAQGNFHELFRSPGILKSAGLELPDIPLLFTSLAELGLWKGTIPLRRSEALEVFKNNETRKEIQNIKKDE